ncbi:MAG TPA: PPK2 family polyphosphate kinase [Ktedonobacteraceae bacterium]|nr:PPK2 family polyphosphate kinase [Ktedonobacteraceae bacterium]
MHYVKKIDGEEKIHLQDFDPGNTPKGIKKDDAESKLQALDVELGELQEMLAAAHQNSVLLLLQGTDTSGKDGTIRHVLSNVNPQGCRVESFKEPTQEELDHDFLWRIHKATPAKGILGVFNRSHYEDVLVVRVQKLAPEKVWQRRYEEINHFEKLLADNGTLILKFFLHISSQEQEKRLLAREQDKNKAWKLSASDWENRSQWDEYQSAYEDMLNKCSKPWAPWYIVPANHKWFRNLAIAHTLVEALRPYKEGWEKDLQDRGEKELALLKNIPHP